MSISHVHLITLHVVDLLKLLGNDAVVEGSLALMSGGEQLHEADLEELCLVIKLEAKDEVWDDNNEPHASVKFCPKT